MVKIKVSILTALIYINDKNYGYVLTILSQIGEEESLYMSVSLKSKRKSRLKRGRLPLNHQCSSRLIYFTIETLASP